MAGRWRKPDYNIGKGLYSSYDLIKHNSHVPHSPLYRPGQGLSVPDRQYHGKQVEEDKMSSDGLNLDLDINEDQREITPRPLYNDMDPRYGSAKGDREAHGMKGYQDRAMEYQTKGSWTDRPGGLGHGQDSFIDKPWSQPHSNSGRMVDPRAGKTTHIMGSGITRLKHGGALLFIRFPKGWGPGMADNIAVACQAFLRSKTYDMGGKFLGIAKYVHDFGYPDGPMEAMGVYHFPTAEKAKLFFQYDMIIRQPDFPPPYGHAEMWIVSNAYLPDNLDEYNTFLLSEVTLHEGRDKREFFEVFQKPFEAYLSNNEVMPYIICSYGPHDRESLRRHAYHHRTIVTCHLFKGVNHLRWLSDQDTYSKFRSLHNQMADEKCMVFTINRDLCP